MRQDYADRIVGRADLEVFMQRLCLIAATIALVSLPAGIVLAQTTPNAGTGTATTAPAAKTETTTAEPAKSANKKPAKKKKMTRRQEIDKSIDSGTVPSRYRSSIPKRYHQYIPFDKR
jgi:hypothetical protein